MDSIKITTGIKRIAINDDPNNVIEFNPGDVLFAERFYEIYREFTLKQAEYETKSKNLDEHKGEVDENGIPKNITEGLEFMHSVCSFMRDKIDILFGVGTSQKVFGETLSLEMIGQFFEGITPFVQNTRSEKLAKYTNGKASRVMK